MDLYRHLQVLWRFKGIIATGVILGVAVALLATFKFSLEGVSYREPEVWTATSRLLVTQEGFPWGRTVLPGTATGTDASGTAADTGGERSTRVFADPSRFGYLSVVYASFLMGDEIKTMLDRVPDGAQIVAAPVRDGTASNAAALPIIELSTSATNARDAGRLNDAARAALGRYLDREQTRSSTPDEQRVQVEMVAAPAGAALAEGRGLTRPVAAFLLSVLAAMALAYALENLRRARSSRHYRTDDGGSPDDSPSTAIAHITRKSA